MMAKKSLQLGRAVEWPDSPQKAKLDRVPNPQADTNYVVRFTAPEFTSLCPVTGQPDFAHLVIDYVPGQWLLESKSLKLYVASFRNHGAFHEDCTVMIGKRIASRDQAEIASHRRLLVSARRHPDRRVLADRKIAEGHVDPRPGRRALSRAGIGTCALILLHFSQRSWRGPKATTCSGSRQLMYFRQQSAQLRRIDLRGAPQGFNSPTLELRPGRPEVARGDRRPHLPART